MDPSPLLLSTTHPMLVETPNGMRLLCRRVYRVGPCCPSTTLVHEAGHVWAYLYVLVPGGPLASCA
eukprot:495894-Prymnesium_polylepis.1